MPHRGAAVLVVVGALLFIAMVWNQSYYGRVDVVVSQRGDCERSSQNQAAQVNFDRGIELGNSVVANARGVPGAVRQNRATLTTQEGAGLLVLDSHIDRGLWSMLKAKIDRQAVRDGVNGKPPFRCDVAYPWPSPFQFGTFT